MRAGLPVVASDTPSVSSALVHDEFALLYPEGSVDQAARAIQRLVNDVDTRTRLGMEARRQLETEFSDTRMANRFVAALRSVAMGYKSFPSIHAPMSWRPHESLLTPLNGIL